MALKTEAPRPHRRSCLQSCGIGCVSLLVLFGVVFGVAYSVTGRYQPQVAPAPALPVDNGFNDYVAAGNLFTRQGGTKKYLGRQASLAAAPDIRAERAMVAGSANIFQALRLGSGKECRVPEFANNPAAYPYLSQTRDLARLIAAKQRVLAANGDYAGAFSAGIDGYELAYGISHGGPLIHALVSQAVRAIVREGMVEAIDRIRASKTGPLITRPQAVVLREDPPAEVVENEYREMVSTLSRMQDMRGFGPIPGPSGESNPAAVPVQQVAGGMAWHFLRDQTLREIESYHDSLLRELAKPTAQRQRVPDPKSVLASVMMPVLGSSTETIEQSLARDRVALCALAISQYRKRAGRLPPSLSNLGLDSRAIIDPFTHHPLIYRPKGSDYLLYSVGPDGVDDGGVPADESNRPPRGDIGVGSFRGPDDRGVARPRFYRRVPHMNTPVLKPGWPPLHR